MTVDATSYQSLFDHSPVAVFLEDFTAVTDWMGELRERGVVDLRGHLSDDLVELARSKVTVLDLNDTAVEMFGEPVRRMLVAGIVLESDDARSAFIEQLVALWEGRERVDLEFSSLQGADGPLDCLLSWSVRTGDSGTIDPAHVVVTIADVSEQRAADRQVERKAAQLQLLQDVSLKISGQRSIDEVFRLIVEGAVEVLEADQARLLVFAEEQDEIVADVSALPYGMPDGKAEVREGIAGWVLAHGEPTLSADIATDSRNRGASQVAARAGEFASLAMAPLLVDAAVVGTLSVLRKRGRASFRAEDVHMLTTLATHAGYAIQSARLLDSLENSLAARDRLLALVSHELRTPLTAIIGMAGTVRDNAGSFDPTELARYASVIVDQGRDLAGIVDDLLSSAAAEAGALEVAVGSVNLWQQVSAVAASLGETARSAGPPFDVEADALRVRQIVRNLVTNARRHGGPTIRIAVSCETQWGFVDVADDGAGVPQDLQPRLFEPFEHGGDHAESVGLGLAVCRDLAERMGGAVTYQRTDGWSTFRLALPRSGQAT